MAGLERSSLHQNSRKSLTEGHGLNVSPRHSGDGQACLGLISTLPEKGRELKGHHVGFLKDE